MTLSESVANELAAKFADAHWVKFKDESLFCEAPVYTRGIPHGLIPGVHSCLNYLVDGLETLREHNQRTESTTVDVVASLPFSPWTQAIAPTIEATADLSIRLCVRDPALLSTGTGKAYIPDSSDPERAIVRPPLLAGPVQVTIADNPFGTSYEQIDAFFNCANTVALFARLLGQDQPVDALHRTISSWVMNSSKQTTDKQLKAHECLVAADVLVLLSCMYPCKWRVAEHCIHETWARAQPLLARRFHKALSHDGGESGCATPAAYLCELGLPVDTVQEGRRWWSAFCRTNRPETCAWHNGVRPLIQALHDHDGSYAVTQKLAADMRVHLERAVRGAFLVNSVDGTTPPSPPCPCALAKSAENVKRPHVDGRFCSGQEQNEEAKGCLVGMKPHQLRQVVALCLGSHLRGAVTQVSRNEGVCFFRTTPYPP
jgi:hypothetical protein